MPHGNAHFWMLFLAACLVLGCVPLTDEPIVSAPCPCPNGYKCCNELNACIKASDTCDKATPSPSSKDDDNTVNDAGAGPSSGETCRYDTDCSPGEVCLSWQVPDGGINGVKQCRSTCDKGPCQENEICELVLHDGKPIDDINVILACISSTQTDGCHDEGCRQCVQGPAGTEGFAGSTICKNDKVTGCFIGLDLDCGLMCKTHVIDACEVSHKCVMDERGANCAVLSSVYGDPWCDDFSCDNCDVLPGDYSCSDAGTNACWSTVVNDRLCEEICLPACET